MSSITAGSQRGRDMTSTGRYPPTPFHAPFAFYSSIRHADPESLAAIMAKDPYFVTQDNGAGAPIHFATTYKQIDMLHHLLNNGAEINQQDDKGFTPLHRAAYLAHYEGYLEIYEYILSRGGDPSIRTFDYDPYLNPGCKLPVDVAVDDANVRGAIDALNKKYANVQKVRVPHADIGDWWTLYDYGLDVVKTWPANYDPKYPEVAHRQKMEAKKAAEKEARKARRAAKPPMALDDDDDDTAKKPKMPTGPIAFLFPGQGSQMVGMCASVKDDAACKQLFDKAKQVLGYDLLDLCLSGPKDKLDDTRFSQPALFVAGACAVEKIRREKPNALAECAATAGLSLGEYNALVHAGILSFEDALRVVKVRAESMAEAAKAGDPHGMLSVVGLADADLEAICSDVRNSSPAGRVCQLANFLFPQGRVVSGHKTCLEQVQTKATAKGALKAQYVAVSGAFHSPLMQSAAEALRKALMEATFHLPPKMTVISNVLGGPFPANATKEDYVDLLCRQLLEPVMWEKCVKYLLSSGKNQMFELGPNQQLKSMTKRIDASAWKAFSNVQP
ncbi:malonyl-CoA-acyl carrier protein transacylase [Pseudoscourfieldia marina]